MAALGGSDELDFATLRDLLEASDSALSKALTLLEAAGYVAVTKGFAGSRPRTWVRSTVSGRRSYAQHLRALREIMAGAAPSPDQPSPD